MNRRDSVDSERETARALEAVAPLRRLNSTVTERCPGAIAIAEESTAWPGVTTPVANGGLGFSYKWNMGWMHDTLNYLSRDAVHRSWHHNDMSFGLLYAFSERFILPLSHNEVVLGNGGALQTEPEPAHGYGQSLLLVLPPLATLILQPETP